MIKHYDLTINSQLVKVNVAADTLIRK